MIDDGERVGFSEGNAEGSKFEFGHFPGAVEIFVRKGGDLWNPASDVVAVGVEFLPLSDGVEDTEVG